MGRLTGGVTRRLDRLSERNFALLISVPAFLLVALFALPPILSVFGLSLFRIELGKDDLTPFVGLFNYVERLPLDSVVKEAIPRTLGFAAAVMLVTIPFALVTALILNRRFRGAGMFLMAVLVPWAVASIVVGVFWRFIFDTHFGIVNGILIGLGLIDTPINWLQDTTNAVVIAVFATAWKAIPLATLLLLAALRTIPEALYRAATMDGATRWETFRFVTLPAIRPTMLVVAVLQIILALQVFDLLFSLTGGGPGKQTYVLVYAIYEKLFVNLSFGYSAALTIVLLAIIIIASTMLLLIQVRSGRKRKAETAAAPDDELQGSSSSLAKTLAGSHGASRFAEMAASYPNVPRTRRFRVPERVFRIGVAVVAGALLFFYVAPIVWVAISSVQPVSAIKTVPPELTLNLWLDGYGVIFRDPRWSGSLFVSLQVAIYTTIIVIVLASPAAYALARFRIPGKAIVTAVLVFIIMVPAIVLAIPVLRIFQLLGLTDTIASLVIVNVAFWVPLVTWLLRNFFNDVSPALEKAARIDGCSRLGALFRITMPAAAPGLAATAILLLIGTWNEFLFAVILGNREAVTITRRIIGTNSFDFAEVMNRTPEPNMLAAAGIVAVLPCLLLVLLFHRRIIAGLTEGLVKG